MKKREKIIILSVHDITPKYSEQIKIILEKLEKLKIKNKDILVVLNERNSYPIEKDKNLIKLIKSQLKKGANLVYHGITHYQDKEKKLMKLMYGKDFQYDSEFFNLSETTVLEKLKKSNKIFKKLFNKKITSIIPARWDLSPSLLNISKKSGIIHIENRKYIHNLLLQKKVRSPVSCFDYGNNRFLNKISILFSYVSIIHAKLFKLPLRFSLHPNDVINDIFNSEIRLLERLIKKDWKIMTSKEYWKYNNEKNKIS